MAEAKPLEALAAELKALPIAHRRQVLAALTPTERAMLDRLLKPVPALADRQSAIKLAALYSPWIGTRLKQAESDDGSMTAATRRALLRVAREAGDDAPGTDQPADRKSLLQVLLGAFGRRVAAL